MTYPWEDLENEESMYRIMIVEDDEVIAGAIRQHLVSWGMDAFCVQDFSDVLMLFFIIQLSVGAMFLLLIAQILAVGNWTVMLR